MSESKADRSECTLRAQDQFDGRFLHFDDFVHEGQEVEIYDDPETERGYRGPRIVCREGDEWWVRPLTEDENERRSARILARIGEL